MSCYNCEYEFDPELEVIYTGCDTIEGQYVEYDAVKCPMCHCENKVS